jgi:hypothetical protein
MATDLATVQSDLDSARTHIGNEDWDSARRAVGQAQAGLMGLPDSQKGDSSIRLERNAEKMLDTIDRLERSAARSANKKRICRAQPRFRT